MFYGQNFNNKSKLSSEIVKCHLIRIEPFWVVYFVFAGKPDDFDGGISALRRKDEFAVERFSFDVMITRTNKNMLSKN